MYEHQQVHTEDGATQNILRLSPPKFLKNIVSSNHNATELCLSQDVSGLEFMSAPCSFRAIQRATLSHHLHKAAQFAE